MRICIDLTSLYDKLSGIEKFTLMISKNMILNDDRNSYVLVFWNEVHTDFINIISKNNVEVIIIKTKNKLIMNQIILPMKLYSIKADRFLFMAFPSPLLFRNKNIVNTVHDMTPWLYPETMSLKGLILFRLSIRNALNISRSIITVSEASKNDIIKKFKKCTNINVVYNGVDEVFTEFVYSEKENLLIKEKYNISEDYILSLGTLEPRKNFKLLLDTFVELKKENLIKNKMVIVGRKGWKFDNLLKDIDDEILKDIIFTDFVDTNELPYIYANARLFVFPSLYEGFGIPIVEASSMNCLVLSSDIEASKEVLKDIGIFFKSNDKMDLKKKIIEVLSYDDEKKGILKAKFKSNSQNYNWKIESCKLLDIIKK